MKKNSLLNVQVSLYSMNPKIHDEITQRKGSFDKTMKSIITLIKNDIPLQISCPIMKKNRGCYNNVLNWAKTYGINVSDDYVIIAKYNHSIDNLNNRLSIDEIEELIKDKAKSDDEYLSNLMIEAENKKLTTSNDTICSICESSICISENGNVYPCAGWQDYVVGNLKNQSIQDIWNNSEKVQYLRNIRNKDFPVCCKCPDRNFCTMCMVRNANEDPKGDPLVVSEYFCNVAKTNKKLCSI